MLGFKTLKQVDNCTFSLFLYCSNFETLLHSKLWGKIDGLLLKVAFEPSCGYISMQEAVKLILLWKEAHSS